MPAAIKVFNTSSSVGGSGTVNTTVYTCPAGRVAKVQIGNCAMSQTQPGYPATSLTVANIVILSTTFSGAEGNINLNTFKTLGTTLTAAGNPSLDSFMSAGQTITTSVSYGAVQASICVVEELA